MVMICWFGVHLAGLLFATMAAVAISHGELFNGLLFAAYTCYLAHDLPWQIGGRHG